VHGQPESFDKSGVVGVQHDSRIRLTHGPAGQKWRVRTFQNGSRESLGRLNGPQMLTRRGFHDHAVIIDPSDGVSDRKDRHDRRRPGDHRIDHRVDDRTRDERPSGVVDEDDIALGRGGRQGEGHGLAATGAAGNHHSSGVRKLTRQVGPDLILESSGHRDDDCLDPGSGQQGPHGMRKQ
jgi:hypothetical protein